MGMRTGLAALMILAGCTAGPAPTPSTWPEGPLEEDERKLLGMHDRLWDLIGLSKNGARELNELVLKLRRNIKYNENRRSELEKLIIPGTVTGQSDTRDRYIESHRKRFQLLGISNATQEELFTAMERVWKDLHDPSAPPEALARAERIQELMRPWLPPCQDDRILEFRKSALRER